MTTDYFKEDMPYKASDTTVTDGSVFSEPNVSGGVYYE